MHEGTSIHARTWMTIKNGSI